MDDTERSEGAPCSKCGWDRSHLGHEDQGLYNFHLFEVAHHPCRSCGWPTHEPTDECWLIDLGTCPYFAEGGGMCCFGCVDEPRCQTERPAEGWPSKTAPSASTHQEVVE